VHGEKVRERKCQKPAVQLTTEEKKKKTYVKIIIIIK